MIVHCKVCGAEWDIGIALPMKLEKFTQLLAMHAEAGCPTCHAGDRSVILGPVKHGE